MTLIELLMFLGVVVSGGFFGAVIAKIIGFIFGPFTGNFVIDCFLLGAAIAFIVLLAITSGFKRKGSIHPPCRCGKSDWKNFELGRSKNFKNVWRCACGKLYSWPTWGLWFEVCDNGIVRLFMKRDGFGRWRKATEKEIANQSTEPTKARAHLPVL